MEVLYGVSPIGLGHASRAAAVGAELRERVDGLVFATGGPAAEFLRSYGFAVKDVVTEPVPLVVSGEMKMASLWYFRYWMGFKRSKGKMTKLFEGHAPDLVVGDEEFTCLELAEERGLKNAMVTDELELGFARGRLAGEIERRVGRWYESLARSVGLVIMPDEGADTGNVRHVGPIVRSVTRTRDDVRGSLGLAPGRRLVLLSLSGAGVGGHLIRPAMAAVLAREDADLAITGNKGTKVTGERVHDLGFVRDNQDLVAAADLVISTAGKSTLDEAAAAGTPVIALPVKNHAEQERNAAPLGYSALDLGRLSELVDQKIGERGRARTFTGARRAAELLLAAAQG